MVAGLLQLLWVFFLPLGVWSYTFRGSVAKTALPLSIKDLSSTTIRLISATEKADTPSFETYLNSKGEFTFGNVPRGTYLLTLDSVTLATDSYVKVVLDGELHANKVFPGHDWKTDLGPELASPIVLEPIIRPTYVIEREKFSTFAMLKNPMVLLTLASLGMVFVLPKLTEGLGKYCHNSL